MTPRVPPLGYVPACICRITLYDVTLTCIPVAPKRRGRGCMQDPSGPFVPEHACAELTALLPALEAVVEMPHCDGLPVT